MCDFISDVPWLEVATTCLQVLQANLVKASGWAQQIKNYETVLLTEGGVVKQKDEVLRELDAGKPSPDVCLRAATLAGDSLSRGMARPKVLETLLVSVIEKVEVLSKDEGSGGPSVLAACEKMVTTIAKHFLALQGQLKALVARCKQEAATRNKEERFQTLALSLSQHVAKSSPSRFDRYQ